MNELNKCIPYLAQLEDTEQYEVRDYIIDGLILTKLKCKGKENIYENWRKILNLFNPRLTLTDKFNRYTELLKFGKEKTMNRSGHEEAEIFAYVFLNL